jgi:hypothetical protein
MATRRKFTMQVAALAAAPFFSTGRTRAMAAASIDLRGTLTQQ